MGVITKEQIAETLRNLAQEFPERTNDGVCRYIRLENNEPVPHCVAAVALHRLGVSIEALDDADDQVDSDITNLVAGTYAAWGDEGFDPPHPAVEGLTDDAADLLRMVQAGADFAGGENPWGRVITGALALAL